MVKVWFHADSSLINRVEKSRTFAEVREGIERISKRVNQLLLLNQLHETRFCSPLLAGNQIVSSDSSDDFYSSPSTKKR